jgi:hypothetical protein
MKNQRNIAFAALLVITAILVGVVVRDHRISVPMAAAITVGHDTMVVPEMNVGPAKVAPVEPALSNLVFAAPQPAPQPIAPAQAPATLKYTAQPGDTISKLAVAFWGSDTKTNEDAIISGNPSLQRDPDRIIAGETYVIPATVVNASTATVTPSSTNEAATTQPTAPADVHELRYSARPGDSVSVLAGALLGSDSSENRDAIINDNPSLGENPDRVLVGKTYRIPVQTGQPLAAAASTAGETATVPTTQPDADQLVLAGSNRELRYTAKPGDNVSTLAQVLLGSDTKENRDAIVNSNPSLKQDPDRVITGQTYWIPAPTAAQP